MGRRHDELMERAGTVPVLRSGASNLLVAQKAEGPRVFDIDNAGYIDFIGAGGATIVGYANQFVLDAVRKALQGGLPEGFHVPQEVELAKTLGQFLPWVGSWWFCRSQDEAFRNVLQWARERTGNRRFLVLDGGSPLRVGAPSSSAIDPANPIREVPGWDVTKIIAALASGGPKLAGLIVDPLMGRFGVVPPPEDSLREIAEACNETGVPFILDERVSGFRVHRGGMAARLDITPDVALYGAALGGGFPIGVAAFREMQPPIDDHSAVPTPHPVSLAAAEAILSILKNDAVYERLEERTEQLVTGLLGLAERFSRPMTVNRLGSIFSVYLTEGPVANRKGVEAADADGYRKLAVLLREEGILFPPEPGRAAFVSSTHGAKDVEETLASCERVFLQIRQEELP